MIICWCQFWAFPYPEVSWANEIPDIAILGSWCSVQNWLDIKFLLYGVNKFSKCGCWPLLFSISHWSHDLCVWKYLRSGANLMLGKNSKYKVSLNISRSLLCYPTFLVQLNFQFPKEENKEMLDIGGLSGLL